MISTVEKVLFLKSIDLFSQIPGEDLAAVALISTEERRDQGEEIFGILKVTSRMWPSTSAVW